MGVKKSQYKQRAPDPLLCYACGLIVRLAKRHCSINMCPWRLYGVNTVICRAPNKEFEAIYEIRDKIDDTISSPDEYQEICKRIDDLADGLGEPTFKQWKEAKSKPGGD